MALTAAQITQLETVRANYINTLATESANPKPTYTVGNQTFAWPEFFKFLREEIEAIDSLIDVQGDETTFDVVSQGYAP